MSPESHAEYPDSNAITQDVVQRHDLGSEVSPPLSPRARPPDYSAESAPPGYQEAGKKASIKLVQKITLIRILASTFIVIIFAVLIAVVVVKIRVGKLSSDHGEAAEDLTETSHWTTLTITTTFTASNNHMVQVTTTTAPGPLVIPTQAHVAFDCPSFPHITSAPSTNSDNAKVQAMCTGLDKEDDEKKNVLASCRLDEDEANSLGNVLVHDSEWDSS
ncbi:hypothetical protein BGZ63DRAFT_419955 [Mariannaea sp. PMI_226]|nr:hypothetical protein BGZ63DRAFT_419955 [Mariannaea sp. PMI_226]